MASADPGRGAATRAPLKSSFSATDASAGVKLSKSLPDAD